MNLDIIILAAGNSKRFGENKLLYKINNKRMFEYVVDLVFEIKKNLDLVEKIIIVSKYNEVEEYIKNNFLNEKILTEENELKEIKFDKEKIVKYIENKNSELGISSSLKLGLKESIENNFVLFIVGDQPYLKYETVENFILGYFNQDKSLGSLAYKEKFGNPCIFSPEYKSELLSLEGDVGGKKIIKNHMNELWVYETNCEKELEDIDVKLR